MAKFFCNRTIKNLDQLRVVQHQQISRNISATRILGLINRTIKYKHPYPDSPLQITRQATPGILYCCLVPTLHQRQGVNRKNPETIYKIDAGSAIIIV